MNNPTFTPNHLTTSSLTERIDKLLRGSTAGPSRVFDPDLLGSSTPAGGGGIRKTSDTLVDFASKEYVDAAVMTSLAHAEQDRQRDLDMNNFQVKNMRAPSHPDDAVSKHYFDRRLEELFAYLQNNKLQHISSRGHVFSAARGVKTFFFNPGFIAPQHICIAAVGWATSPYKIKPEEVSDFRRHIAFTQLKLFFMVNNEVRTELSIEKDSEIGYTLKQLETPIFLNKGDNLMLVTDVALEDSSVNVAFYDRL